MDEAGRIYLISHPLTVTTHTVVLRARGGPAMLIQIEWIPPLAQRMTREEATRVMNSYSLFRLG